MAVKTHSAELWRGKSTVPSASDIRGLKSHPSSIASLVTWFPCALLQTLISAPTNGNFRLEEAVCE